MAMDAERRQAELIAQFSAQAAALSSAPQLAALVLEATSHPALFAFSELLTLPALSKVRALPLACALLRYSGTRCRTRFWVSLSVCLRVD
jgi:COP9 signalosome complex subunit 7